MPLIPGARLAWAHDWVHNPALNAAFQTLPGSSFIIKGADPLRIRARFSISQRLRTSSDGSAVRTAPDAHLR
jgi:hypothetical protein